MSLIDYKDGAIRPSGAVTGCGAAAAATAVGGANSPQRHGDVNGPQRRGDGGEALKKP